MKKQKEKEEKIASESIENQQEITSGSTENNSENQSQETAEQEADKIAVDFESKGVQFYEKLRENVDDPREKAFFGMLASIEREHFLSLQGVFEFFQDPAAWYRLKEKPHVDGG